MKYLILVVSLVLSSGCVIQRPVHIVKKPDGTIETMKLTQIAIFNKAAVDNLTFGKKTKTTEALLSYDKASAETQEEAIKALAELLGTAAGIAAKTAIKP